MHGHSAGGTNPSLVEAMWLGLAVFAFDVEFNRATTDGKAAYFGNAKQLADLLDESDVHLLEQIAQDMKCVALERYTWSLIFTNYRSLLLSES